jgi:hypothetical protein
MGGAREAQASGVGSPEVPAESFWPGRSTGLTNAGRGAAANGNPPIGSDGGGPAAGGVQNQLMACVESAHFELENGENHGSPSHSLTVIRIRLAPSTQHLGSTFMYMYS